MKKTYQAIILGPGGVGKTRGCNALMHILKSLGFRTSEVKPWTEDLVVTSNYVIHNAVIPANYFPGIPYNLQLVIYDMGGQFKYKEMWKSLAEDTDAIIAVVDMTRSNTLKQIPLMLPTGIMEGVPVRLVVNKADLYADFSRDTEKIAHSIFNKLQKTVSNGVVNYRITYRGDGNFIFAGWQYRYGDIINVSRNLKFDNEGNAAMRLADFEVVCAEAFKEVLPELSDHNGNLFGREFTLQIFNIVYSWMTKSVDVLSEDILIGSHLEAPPFIAWGEDPDAEIPKVNKLTREAILTGVQRMLIEENDMMDMVIKLRTQGYNFNIDDRLSWDFTSAFITDEDPSLTYKPINKAFMPPYFIKSMIEYAEAKETGEESYFI
ncbi:MAG: GTPase domain-containing protein [Candidatus Heimdallarchaeota archaeon]|nr:GTPase domain-containing protein [Candidatus Heimdallarchaeota archaeon]